MNCVHCMLIAMLYTSSASGVNTPDHAVMFANLALILRERVTSLVATLRAKDCSSVKGLLSKLLAQLLSCPELVTVLFRTQQSVLLVHCAEFMLSVSELF